MCKIEAMFIKVLNTHKHTPARCVATSVTEPFLAGVAVNHTRWVVDATVAEKHAEIESGLGVFVKSKPFSDHLFAKS